MEKETDKKKYVKPELKTIELVAEEVLAVGCKLGAGGFNFGNPIGCIAPTNCSAIGS